MTAPKDGGAELLDVVEVQINAPHTIRILDRGKSERTAEAIIRMAVMRRGVETHFYTTVPAGKYNDGDVLAQREKGRT